VNPEWMKIMTGAGMWIIGIIFGLSALIQSFLFYRLARGTGKRMKISRSSPPWDRQWGSLSA